MFKKYNVLYFFTLTFNDEWLPSNEDECLKTVRVWLHNLQKNNKNIQYRINIDYGGKFNRIHLHGISNYDLSKFWIRGYIKSTILNFTKDDINRVSSYVNKLVNHSFKIGTTKIIYSRFK